MCKGFRWDYLNRHALPTFNKLKSAGSHADYIVNSFSTVTFPNHWSIVTGMHEEAHGIVQNVMYDRLMNATFNFTAANHTASSDALWFGQNSRVEPIWSTNQRGGAGRRSAAEWVGSHVPFSNQTIVHIAYNHSTPFRQLVDQFVQMLATDSGNDPAVAVNFGALYFDEPDHTGHLYGPYSSQMSDKLAELDQLLAYLLTQVKEHGLAKQLNIIVTYVFVFKLHTLVVFEHS